MTSLGEMKMTEEYEKIELEKFENKYKQLLEKFLFGKLGITAENYKKYEEFQGDGSIFKNPKECFVCNFIGYLIDLSKAKIFLEVGESSLKGAKRFYYLRKSFEEIVLNASHQDLTEEEKKEIFGILSDIFTEHLSVFYELRKKNHKLLVKKNDEILNKYRKENEKSSQ